MALPFNKSNNYAPMAPNAAMRAGYSGVMFTWRPLCIFVLLSMSSMKNQIKGWAFFHAVKYMKDDNKFFDYELEQAEQTMEWFNKHLESPLDYLNKQKSKKSDIFISWFKNIGQGTYN